MKNIQTKISKLRKEIEYHNHLYYTVGEPELTDSEYDKLYDELLKLENRYPDLNMVSSPTNTVGSPIVTNRVKHHSRMYSLDKVYSKEDLKKWFNKIVSIPPNHPKLDFWCDLKLDGVAISLIYLNGIYDQALTRGDGEYGEDVTDVVRMVSNVPETLVMEDPPTRLEIRGEIVALKEDLTAINSKYVDHPTCAFWKHTNRVYANTRSLVASIIKPTTVLPEMYLPLRFYAYSVNGDLANTHVENLFTVADLMFDTTAELYAHTSDVDDICEYIDRVEEVRSHLAVDIDGVVIKVDDLLCQEALGYTSKFPRYAIAYKYQVEETTTILREIRLQIGITGKITPVAIMDPVTIDGVTITRATLNNFDIIKNKDIRINDTVVIRRAGEVIPEIVSVILRKRPIDSKPYESPVDGCPFCKKPLVKEGVEYRCTNVQCEAMIVARIAHFASKAGLDIRGVGMSLIEKLYYNELIRDVADLIALKEINIDSLFGLDGMGRTSASNLVKSIAYAVENATLEKYISALCIPYVGRATAKLLCNHFDSIGSLSKATTEQLLSIPGIGEEMTSAIINIFKNHTFIDVIDRMTRLGLDPKVEGTATIIDGPFVDKTVLFTGKLNMSRGEAIDMAMRAGATIANSVTKKLDYLVVGENPGSKYNKALLLGNVEIINESTFERLCE